jgi:hypothetical protein
LKRLLTRMGRDLLSEPHAGCRGPMLDPKLYKREIDATGEDPRPRRELVLLASEEVG